MTIQQARYGNQAGSTWSNGADGETQLQHRRDSGRRPTGTIMGMNEEQLAKALGWFSIGLGLAEAVAPEEVARLIGVSDDAKTRTVLRAAGLREIVSGVGILAQPRPAGWLWARVGGDALDLSLLAAALNSDTADHNRVTIATLAVAGVTVLDVLCSQQLSRSPDQAAGLVPGSRGKDVEHSITINQPPEELYLFWRNFENLPRFMSHLESVQVLDNGRSHWKAKAPAGTTVEWDAEVIDDQPNQLIAWRSLAGADVDNSGVVRFVGAPGDRGTEVHVQMRYNPPGGAIGAAVAKLFGEAPEQQVYDDLRALKQVIETGEIVRSDASIHRHMHPAQPPDQPAQMVQR